MIARRRPGGTGQWAWLPPTAAALVIGLAILCTVIAINLSETHGTTLDDWREDRFRPLRSYPAMYRRMLAVTAPRLATYVLGSVEYGSRSYPIVALTFRSVTQSPRPRRVLICAGLHGNEIAGPEAAIRFAEDLARNAERYGAVEIDLIPLANPWGWSRNIRYNGGGEDINRDFSSSRTEEARVIRDFLGGRGSYDLILDLHESKNPGYFAYDYSGREPSLADAYRRVLKLSDARFESTHREGGITVSDGVLAIPTMYPHLRRLANRLSFDGYARLFRSQQVYVVETPLTDSFQRRVQVQLRSLRAFIEALDE